MVADHATGEAGQDRRKSRATWSIRHVPIGRGRGAEGAVPRNPPPHRWPAAGPFAAMTAAHPGASKSPDRTGVCGAGRSAPSQCEMVTGTGFSSPNQPDQERTTAYRVSSGPDSRSDAHCGIILGDWEKPSGESRLKRARVPARTARACGARWIGGGTRGVLYGPRSTAPRAAAAPRSGGGFVSCLAAPQ